MTHTFLSLLWPEIPQGSRLLTWTLPDKLSNWHKNTSGVEIDPLKDTYVGVGLRPESFATSRHHRGKSSDVIAVPGLVADLDCATPGHHAKKGKPFPDSDVALYFLSTLPLPPTIIVHSGGGLQAWWLFKETEFLATPEERSNSERLAAGWVDHLRRLAFRDGWRDAIDAVWDLARVMRLPGSFNHKSSPPKPVTMLSSDGPRYNPCDFETWKSSSSTSREPENVTALVVSAEAIPARIDELEALRQSDRLFRETWEEKRQHMGAKNDHSPSAYDLGVASRLAIVGWSPQEITDALVYRRRLLGHPLKLREDYYRETTRKAMKARIDHEMVEQAEEVLARDEVDRDDLTKIVEYATGVAVASVILHGGKPGVQYTLVLASGTHVTMGAAADLLRVATWRPVAFEHGRITVSPKESSKIWIGACRALQRLVEIQESDEVTESSRIRRWVQALAVNAAEVSEFTSPAERAELIESNATLSRSGKIGVRLHRVVEDARFRHERITETEVLRMLRESKFEWTLEQARTRDGKNIKGGYWWLDYERLWE